MEAAFFYYSNTVTVNKCVREIKKVNLFCDIHPTHETHRLFTATQTH